MLNLVSVSACAFLLIWNQIQCGKTKSSVLVKQYSSITFQLFAEICSSFITSEWYFPSNRMIDNDTFFWHDIITLRKVAIDWEVEVM